MGPGPSGSPNCDVGLFHLEGAARAAIWEMNEMTSPSITIDLTPQGTMERLEWLAWFSDSAIRIPGTARSMGADGVLSLVPGVGTLVGGILMVAWKGPQRKSAGRR